MKIVESKSKEGITYKGLFSESKVKTKRIIIHVHGMAGSALLNNFYQPMHDYYPKMGYSFLVGENRGTGQVTEFNADNQLGLVVVGNAHERFEDCVLDIQAWIDFAKDKGYEEIWLQAHSLGPSKVVYYLNTQKLTHISGVVFISPSDMLGLIKQDPLHKSNLDQAQQLVSSGKGQTLLDRKLWDSEYMSAATYVNFFGPLSNLGIFNYHDDSLGWEALNSIQVPVFAITGTKDDGVASVCDPQIAMNKLTQELKQSPRVKTLIYKDAPHSFDGFENRITKDVIDFITAG